MQMVEIKNYKINNWTRIVEKLNLVVAIFIFNPEDFTKIRSLLVFEREY